MNVADTLGMAMGNLARRKGRTVLTAAGVVVGVAALVLIVSLGLGIQRQVVKLFETDESLRTLTAHRTKGDGGGKKKAAGFGFGLDQIVPLSDKDLEELKSVPGVVSVKPQLDMFLRVAFEGAATVVHPVEGITPEEEQRFAGHVKAGSMWTNRTERVCLLPNAILEMKVELKPEQAVGKKVTFSGFFQADTPASDEDVYTVVGILDDDAFSFKGRPIFVPMEHGLALRERMAAHPMLPSKKGSYLSAELRLADPRTSEDVAKRLRNLGYSSMSTRELLKIINMVFLLLEAFMACIGAIGLVVSLFGIANTMAMAVLERTREIGIMKALGARNGEIGRLFLAEAAAIGALGGVFGLAVGALIGKMLNGIAHLAVDLPANVSLFHVSFLLAAGSVGFSMFVSVVAGWIPARRAARMEPVTAVRYE
ncbi:MAG TPA: FtsX-like permease family protein [Planctomycetota bacterium]|nr:FtsX-like permease family protein [Planctomycetota bacterium]